MERLGGHLWDLEQKIDQLQKSIDVTNRNVGTILDRQHEDRARSRR